MRASATARPTDGTASQRVSIHVGGGAPGAGGCFCARPVIGTNITGCMRCSEKPRLLRVMSKRSWYRSPTGLRHVATTRDTLVKGALRAALLLAKAKPGRYTMASVLGL